MSYVRNNIFRNNLSLTVTIVLFVLFFAVGGFTFRGFFSGQVFANLFIDNAYLIIIAVGETIVIISGGIDISVSSVVAFVCMCSAWMLQHGWAPGVVMPLMLVIGTFGGYLMGYIIYNYNVQPFIATLAGQFFYRGLCSVISTQSIRIDNPAYTFISNFQIAITKDTFISISVVVAIIVVIAASLALKYTKFGRSVYAVGGNRQSAMLMGLNVRRTSIGVYALSGFCAALGGLVFSLYTLSGYGLQNIGLEMDAIAACVIGGTLLTGGVGKVLGSMFGVLIQGVIQTIIIFQGTLSSWWTKVTVAALLCLFILLQRVVAIRTEMSRGKGAEAVKKRS